MNIDVWPTVPPKTKWRMMHLGEWRPVTNMFMNEQPTTLPMRATSAVLYVAADEWYATAVSPGEIVLDPDYQTLAWD